ncbi:MAG: CDC27 family protein, partial [Myxococcota bacterium]|nr:CDC27 family protein [Myxococcota bacterium]
MLHKTVMLIALVPSLALAGPKEANEAFVKGQAAYKAKSYAEAERLFRKAVNEDSANAQFRLPLAKSMYKQKRYDEAIHELKQLIKIAPTMAAARYQMALVQRKAGMASPLPADQTAYLKEAVGFYKGYLAVEQQDPDGYYGLAETYRLLGEARLSVSNYERYVELEKRPKEQKYVKKAKQKIADLKAALAGGVVAGQKPILS